jgi:protein-disulfide isomerase
MIGAIRRLGAALSLAALLAAGTAVAQGQTKPAEFDPAQESAIRKIVRDYLVAHPEVLIEALQVYQTREKAAAAERKREALKAHDSALNGNPDDPVVGNPQGDVVVVEFFDYRCPYCHKVAGPLREAIRADGNIRLVMKEFPILGPDSQFAARAALASVQQGLYEPFHFALMAAKGNLDQKAVMTVARQVGLNLERLQSDMQSPEIDAILRRNFQLAEILEISGTPAFVIGDEIVPGALDMQSLKDMVAKVRSKSS